MIIATKIIPHAQLASALTSARRPLVFTNGVFDVLHPGHVDYLERARSLGDTLMVALNSDVSARRLGKGADRPINPEADRAVMVAALASVEFVTFFDEDTPIALLHDVRPDLYVKGGDYDIDALEESRFVRSYGGDAQGIPFRAGYSTTGLLARIRASVG